MAVSGLPNPCENHAKSISRLALDMMDIAENVCIDGESVVSNNHNIIQGLKNMQICFYAFKTLDEGLLNLLKKTKTKLKFRFFFRRRIKIGFKSFNLIVGSPKKYLYFEN